MWVKLAPEGRQKLWTRLFRQRVALVAALLVFGLFSLFMFLLGAYYHQKGAIYGVRDILRQNVRIPLNYAWALRADVPSLALDVKHKHYQRIAYNREVALRRGGLLPDVRDEVPAFLRFGDKMVKAKIRLKGDLPDHWVDESKWSLRIRLRGEETFMGMKQFSIQHPRNRAWLDEWFLHRLMEANGLIAQRYEFVQVSINGKNMGLYGLQEHFEKRLLENNRNREGPLFKVDTSFYWYHKPGIAPSIYGSALDAYQASRLLENPGLQQQFQVARNLFEAFREGKLPTHQVFDIKRFADLFAILDLVGSPHGGGLDNMAFYYNPVTSRLEPSAADAAIAPGDHILGADRRLATKVTQQVGIEATDDWFDLLFRDPVFYAEYVRSLERFSAPGYLKGFFQEHAEAFAEQTRILHTSFPWYSFDESRRDLEHNRRQVAGFLTPKRSLQVYSKAAFSQTPDFANGGLTLEMASLHAMPIEIIGVSLPNGARLVPSEETIIQPYRLKRPLEYHDITLVSPSTVSSSTVSPSTANQLENTWTQENWAGLMLEHRIVGSSTPRHVSIHPGPHRDQNFLEHDFMRREANASTFDFLRIDDEKQQIVFAPGQWTLAESLILPAGYTVIGGPGLHLDLLQGATILSHSPLELRGTEDEPIVIESSDAQGQGLTVMKADGASVLEYVRFRNLSSPRQAGWQLTGSVTFYESPATLSNCRFMTGRSEDALNVVRGEFVVESTLFENIQSDAIDVDFGQGTITNTSFLDIGNDAIDVSGTVLVVKHVLIERAGDKGLSVGEASKMKASDIRIHETAIALAAKDLSEIVVDNLEIEACGAGFAVFQKKPEFGPGTITATHVTRLTAEEDFLVEERSSVSLNGRVITPTHKKVEDELYGAKYGKKSR